MFAAVAVAGYAGWALLDVLDDAADTDEVLVDVPELSATAEAGREAFDRRCVQCHGVHGGGSPAGPPLVHPVYRSAHHADVAFTLAVRRGVSAHHWRFGDMPPQPDTSPDEVEAVITYIRELQRANNID
ncbi:MAG: c-type cytochrome [Candidatus Rokuibacteriota bacterium]